ncbi:double-strand break repair helicase AddA [Brevundimonas halotolerans]|uniref:DNA 3'-5' helicase n=1 Tax=Brevundimonas halotolerans TaxID=69670 RepID=A0A7W9A3Z1_9CAUL|nr:double-strand break repair helicase AddA [Brevundimonas halotolerans]MBB5660750.1 ATP-dependent helicase/nuclease subunit A [Brevundimonas halotolerans]
MTRSPQAIAADPAVNAFVMANAGSGKTTTLVNRVARLLLAGSAPGAILCLTFTKAAAAEMQRRLYERLGDWAVAGDARLRDQLAELEERAADSFDAHDLSRARALFARALETPGGLKIQTIHAFCEQLLRRFPVEAEVSPLFRVIDEAEAADIRRRARDRVALADDIAGLAGAYLHMAGKLSQPDFEAMFDRFESKRAELTAYVAEDGGAATLQDRVAASVGLEGWTEPEAAEHAAVTAPDFDAAAWLDAAAIAAGCKQPTAQVLAQNLQAAAEAVLNGEAPVELVQTIFFTDKGLPRGRLGVKDMGPATLDWLAREQARLAEHFERARAARVALDTVSALVLAYAYGRAYETAKATTGALDFADLIQRARHLLTDGPGAAWVLYKLDGGVDHVLVDEAQDTSPEQWSIVRALTAEFFTGAGSRDGTARTVFVVGDEKQSIFSFQGAAPERLAAEAQDYDRAITGVGGVFQGVELLQSWRSTAEVLAAVDAVFAEPALARALSPGRGEAGEDAAALIRHQAARADGLAGTIDLWPPLQDETDEERRAWDEPLDASTARGARRRVAERIADEIRTSVEAGHAVHDKKAGLRPMDWGDVLILVRKRGPMFEEVLRALKQRGVPVAGADRLTLSAHPVFQDLLALGRVALQPADGLTLAGVLRSPLCDLSEDALFDLAHGREGSLWGVLNARAGQDPTLAEARDLIADFREAARVMTPFDLYGRLLNRLDGRGLSVRQRFLTRLGSEAADAMDAFLDQARAAEGRGPADLERFCHLLASLDQTIKREMDEPRGEVRVMTAHSSKGLEAPVVILPDVIFEEPRGDALLETEGGAFLWCGSSGEDCAASQMARDARKRRGEEESLRLLYVGLTRARDRLIVTGRYASNRKLENLKAWWAPILSAFERLEGVREVKTATGEARRYGADPVAMARTAAPADAVPPPPAWLTTAPRAEAPERRMAPGRMEDAARTPAPSPLSRVGGGLGRWRRGELIHRLLERLPDVAPDRRGAAAVALLAGEPDLEAAQKAEMAAAALGVLDDARFAEVFGPASRAEVALSGSAPELPAGVVVSARLDRLVVTPRRVLVIDFKTNRPAPDRVEDADPAYVRQLAIYWAVLRRLYPERTVEAALVWTDGPRLTPVPESLMRQALHALVPAL